MFSPVDTSFQIPIPKRISGWPRGGHVTDLDPEMSTSVDRPTENPSMGDASDTGKLRRNKMKLIMSKCPLKPLNLIQISLGTKMCHVPVRSAPIGARSKDIVRV